MNAQAHENAAFLRTRNRTCADAGPTLATGVTVAWAAGVVLALHLLVIAFNLLGLAVIVIGAKRGWRCITVPWWRLLHLASWAVVALQAVLGRACFLTLWQDRLEGAGGQGPLVARWVNALIYWPLPLWVFTLLYLAAFGWVVALFWIAPVRWRA